MRTCTPLSHDGDYSLTRPITFNFGGSLPHGCDFTSNNTEIYNKPFTLHELTHAIITCGQTSVGPDDIHYDFSSVSVKAH